MDGSRVGPIRLFVEPRCCTFVGVAIAAGGLGLGAASAAGAFSPSITEPNTAQEAEQMLQLQAQYLPAIEGMQAAAQEGGSFTLPPDVAQALEQQGINLTGGQLSPDQQSQLASLQQQLATAQGSSFFGTPTAQTTALQNQINAIKAGGNKPNTVNFAGEGTAQTQGQIEQQLAAGQLAEGQKYDPQFIATQLAQEQQANPQQFAARQAEYQMLENAINNPQTSPVSNTLQNQVTGQVAAGSGLTPEEQAMLNAAVANQPGEGGQGSPDFSNALTTGFQGEQRALMNAGAGTNFLSSGETPADLAYRQEQADIGNLASYASGTTPESQFGQVSSAGAPIAPELQTGYQPAFNGVTAAQQGQSGAINEFGQNVNQQLQYSNPWTSGISAVLGGVNALAGTGVL